MLPKEMHCSLYHKQGEMHFIFAFLLSVLKELFKKSLWSIQFATVRHTQLPSFARLFLGPQLNKVLMLGGTRLFK
jgi:hypothetical protein